MYNNEIMFRPTALEHISSTNKVLVKKSKIISYLCYLLHVGLGLLARMFESHPKGSAFECLQSTS